MKEIKERNNEIKMKKISVCFINKTGMNERMNESMNERKGGWKDEWKDEWSLPISGLSLMNTPPLSPADRESVFLRNISASLTLPRLF